MIRNNNHFPSSLGHVSKKQCTIRWFWHTFRCKSYHGHSTGKQLRTAMAVAHFAFVVASQFRSFFQIMHTFYVTPIQWAWLQHPPWKVWGEIYRFQTTSIWPTVLEPCSGWRLSLGESPSSRSGVYHHLLRKAGEITISAGSSTKNMVPLCSLDVSTTPEQSPEISALEPSSTSLWCKSQAWRIIK